LVSIQLHATVEELYSLGNEQLPATNRVNSHY